MAERTALLLVCLAAGLTLCVGVVGLSALGANEGTVGLAIALPLCGGAYAASRVSMHYDDANDRERR